MLPYVLLGGGGHAKVVMNILNLCQYNVLAVCSITPDENALGIKQIAENEIESMRPDQVYLANCVGSIKSTSARDRLFQKFKRLGFTFPPLIHPSSIVSSDVIIGEGAHIMAGTVIQSGGQIGPNCIINTQSSVDHDCNIGRSTHIAPGVTLSGNVIIGDNCHIGTAAVIIQGIHIGNNSLVGAGSIVTKNLSEDSCFVNGR